MPLDVRFEGEGFVRVSVSSPCAKEDHYAALERAVQLCVNHDCSRILVDLRNLNTGTYSAGGCFSFGKKTAQYSKPFRIAHVLPRDPKSRKDVEFTSTVESNRGKDTREFDTVEQAKNWLLNG
jgi:hypothetical protein